MHTNNDSYLGTEEVCDSTIGALRCDLPLEITKV